MNGRKTYEVVGYVMDGYFLCTDCHGPEGECGHGPDGEDARCEHSPVFLGDCQPEDMCDACYSKWMADPRTRTAALMSDDVVFPPGWVFLDGDGPDRDAPTAREEGDES